MSFVDDCTKLADDVVGQLGADTAIDIIRRIRGAYDPATQTYGADTNDVYSLTRYLRSASPQSYTGASAGRLRMEEFIIDVSVADLVSAGWVADGTKPLDERSEVLIGGQTWHIIKAERQVCEKMMRLTIRTDTGNTT